jgi:replicative DNA helicase
MASDASSPRPGLHAPHNLDAERGVLGAMLLDASIIDDVMQEVRAEDFYLPAHQHIFRAIALLHEQGRPVELTLLADGLRREGHLDEAGGLVYLAGLEQGVLTIGAAAELARTVADKATYRRLMAAADGILREASEERRPVAEALDLAEKLIFDLGRSSRSSSFRPMRELMEGTMEEVAKLMANRGQLPGLRTHFTELDRLLNGLQRSDLIILAARPSIGKTAFALNVALNVAYREKVPVAVFSLEMGAEQLSLRLLSTHGRIASHEIRSGRLTEQAFEQVRQAAASLAELPLHIDDTPGLSLLQVRSRARRLKARHPDLGLIIVDYLQLMSGSPEMRRRDQSRQQEVGEISRGLKELARELDLPLMALSQLSRNIEQRGGKSGNARPMLSDLRESGAIEQDADVVMFVHRERHGEEAGENDRSRPGKPLPIPTEIVVEKHRNGPTGVANLVFFKDHTLFANMARPEGSGPPR